MSLAAAAQWWTCRGFAVFPIEPRGKRPLGLFVPHGVKDASSDPRVVAAWWRQEPAANIGLAIPKGTFVVDLDGEQALQSWFALCDRHGALPPTLSVTTGRGKHLYFRSSIEVKNSTGRLCIRPARFIRSTSAALILQRPRSGLSNWRYRKRKRRPYILTGGLTSRSMASKVLSRQLQRRGLGNAIPSPFGAPAGRLNSLAPASSPSISPSNCLLRRPHVRAFPMPKHV